MSSGIRSSGHFRFLESAERTRRAKCKSYPSKLVPFDLFGLPPSEASLVDEIGQILLHKLIDLLNRLLESCFGCASNVQVQRRILGVLDFVLPTEERVTHHCGCHGFVWVV